MKHVIQQIAYNPITVFFFLLAAFLLATVPARAGGIPENLQGEGGAPYTNAGTAQGVRSEQGTYQSKTEIETITMNDTSSATGIVLSQDENSLMLQTYEGRRNFTLTEDSIIKENGTVTSFADIHRGDIMNITVDRQGNVLNANSEPGLLGNIQSILLALGTALVTAIGITQLYARRHIFTGPQHTTRRYVFH